MAAEWDAAMEFVRADLVRLQAELAARDAELDGRNAELGASRQSSDEQLAAAEGLRAALVDAERTVREAVETADRAAAELISDAG